jgi:hypothetical protein
MDLMEGYVDDLLAHDRNLKFDAKNGIAAWKSLIRAFCIWLYPYPAFLRYAAHSAGG